MSGSTFCARCATWRPLFTTCACPQPRPAPGPSNLSRVVTVAASIASDRIRRSGGPLGVTAEEMSEASAIARTEVEA